MASMIEYRAVSHMDQFGRETEPEPHGPTQESDAYRRSALLLAEALDEIDRLEQVLRRIEREDIGLVPTDMTHGCGLIAKNALKESGNA